MREKISKINTLIMATLFSTYLNSQEVSNNEQDSIEDRSELIPQIRDPFSFNRDLKMLKDKFNDGALPIFRPSTIGNIVPQLALKGIIVKAENSSPIGLLQVGRSDVHMVKEGDEIGFKANDPSQVIKIKKISRLSIIVEAGTLGDVIIVR